MPPSLALISATIVIAVPLSRTHSISYSTPTPFRAFSPSVLTLAMYGLNSELVGEACTSLPFTYAFMSARNLLNPLGLQPAPQKLVPGTSFS